MWFLATLSGKSVGIVDGLVTLPPNFDCCIGDYNNENLCDVTAFLAFPDPPWITEGVA
jgi:hypothetical protein